LIRLNHHCKFWTAILGLFILFNSSLKAQDVQPRVYAPSPTGVNLFTFGYANSSGDMLFDRTIPIENVQADIHSFSASYSRSTALFGQAGRFDVSVPLVAGSWEGEILEQTQSTSRFGMGDPVLRYALFVTGAPGLTKEEFAGFSPKTIIGISMRITVPLGQYDPEKLINLGSNRWVFSPQIGIRHSIGRLVFEGYTGVWFFTDNRDFLGSQVRSQEPLYTFQLHTSYEFDNGMWIAVSTRQSLGGVVKVEDGDRLDPESNNRIGLSFSMPVKPRYFLKLFGTTGTTATVGNNYDTIGLAWQVLF